MCLFRASHENNPPLIANRPQLATESATNCAPEEKSKMDGARKHRNASNQNLRLLLSFQRSSSSVRPSHRKPPPNNSNKMKFFLASAAAMATVAFARTTPEDLAATQYEYSLEQLMEEFDLTYAEEEVCWSIGSSVVGW